MTMIAWRHGIFAATAAVLVVTTACAGGATTQGASTTPPSAATSRQLDSTTSHQLDTAIDDAMRAAGIPGAIVGIWSPEGDYVRAFGVADKATGTPMKTDFYSRIGSETKTFTVTAVLQLADQNKIGLDDPIRKYIDGVPGGDKITVRELARMQSGLFNYSSTKGFQDAITADPHREYPPKELLDWAFAEPAVFPPGQGFQYSNTNTILLGQLVEKVSGHSLPDYLDDHVLTPLGMGHTNFPTSNAFPDPHAQGYTDLNGDGKSTTATDWNPSWAWSAGAMISTLDDLHTWAPAVATGKLLSPAMQQQRLQTVREKGFPADDGYGLGIFNVAGWIGHNGSLPGYQTVAVYLPERQTTLVALINTDISPPGSGEPSSSLATAITKVISPGHVYKLGP